MRCVGELGMCEGCVTGADSGIMGGEKGGGGGVSSIFQLSIFVVRIVQERFELLSKAEYQFYGWKKPRDRKLFAENYPSQGCTHPWIPPDPDPWDVKCIRGKAPSGRKRRSTSRTT